MKIPQIANYRPIALATIFLMIGITIGALSFKSLIVFSVAMGIILLLCVVAIFLRKSPFIVITVFLLVGFSIMSTYSILVTPKEIKEGTSFVECRVSEVLSGNYGNNRYVVEELSFEGERYSSKALLKTSEEFQVGDRVAVVGSANVIDYQPFNSYSSARYVKGIKYEIQSESAVKVGSTRLSWYESIRTKLRKVYVERLGKEDAGIALGLVIGDVSYVSNSTNEEMRASGVYHLFSVSGLHVGFMVVLVYLFFKLFRIHKNKALYFVTILLLGYGILTGFPVGVVRASIMSIISLLSFVLVKRYDPLNVLSFTAMLILLFSPIELFSVSFLLSIGAVLGITCFYEPLKRLCKWENKTLRKVWYSVAMSLSANSFVLPISTYFFSTTSLYFIIANLVIVPVSSIIYGLLVPLSALALIWEPLGILISPLSYPLIGIRLSASLISSMPFSLISLSFPLVAGVLYTIALFILSRFYMGSKKSKIILSSTLFIACALIIFIF